MFFPYQNILKPWWLWDIDEHRLSHRVEDLGGHDTQAERALELYDRLGCEDDQLPNWKSRFLQILLVDFFFCKEMVERCWNTKSILKVLKLKEIVAQLAYLRYLDRGHNTFLIIVFF